MSAAVTVETARELVALLVAAAALTLLLWAVVSSIRDRRAFARAASEKHSLAEIRRLVIDAQPGDWFGMDNPDVEELADFISFAEQRLDFEVQSEVVVYSRRSPYFTSGRLGQ